MKNDTVRLCALSEIGNPGTIELSWGEGDWPLSLFLVRRGADVRGYVNRCPHAGHELNLMPNQFLTSDGELILCRSHGARFRPDDGVCVLGPCAGAALTAFAVSVVGNDVEAVAAELDALSRAARA